MFDFLSMLENHEERKVDNYDDGKGLVVNTCLVTDSDQPYETAVMHPSYNDGIWVVVQQYNTKEEAQAGHNAWVAIMTAPELPKGLIDVGGGWAGKMLVEMGINKYPRKEV